MGRFIYDGIVKTEIEDRLLAHLQVVISSKLRRGESFAFTWKDDADAGHGRTSVWMHPRSSLVFKFFGGREPALNRAWLDVLAVQANSPAGLMIVPEPAEGTVAEPPTTGTVAIGAPLG